MKDLPKQEYVKDKFVNFKGDIPHFLNEAIISLLRLGLEPGEVTEDLAKRVCFVIRDTKNLDDFIIGEGILTKERMDKAKREKKVYAECDFCYEIIEGNFVYTSAAGCNFCKYKECHNMFIS